MTYEFTLNLALNGAPPLDTILQRLAEADCTDALVGSGRSGRIALFFSREGSSLESAIASATHSAREALSDLGVLA